LALHLTDRRSTGPYDPANPAIATRFVACLIDPQPLSWSIVFVQPAAGVLSAAIIICRVNKMDSDGDNRGPQLEEENSKLGLIILLFLFLGIPLLGILAKLLGY
jgi:hypothetical protein